MGYVSELCLICFQVVRRYSTSVTAPKRDRRQKGLSANVKAFLERKDEEEKKKGKSLQGGGMG